MCDFLSPSVPEMKKPPAPEPEKQKQSPQFGASNKELNSRKNLRADKKGTRGFKIALQTPNKKSGLNVGGT